MQRYTRVALLLGAFCLCVFVKAVCAADVTISSRVDKTQVTIGTKITYTVTVDYVEPVIMLSNIPTDQLSSFTIRKNPKQEVEDRGGGRMRITKSVTIVAYDIGQFSILPCVLPYKESMQAESVHEVRTDEIVIEVLSVLPAEGDMDIKPLKDIHDPFADLVRAAKRFGLWAGAVLLLLISLFILLRNKKGLPFFRQVPLTPYEQALKKLFLLKKKNLVDAGTLSVYADELSDTVREYIGVHFSYDTMELTTGELAQRIESIVADEGLANDILRFLVQCDAMKFARVVPDSAASHALLDTARSVLERVHVIPVGDDTAEERV